MNSENSPVVRYQWYVEEDADTPIEPGKYVIEIVEGGTYRNLATRRKYTVKDIDTDDEQITYRYIRGDGEPIERTGHPTELAVVEAVGDTAGGISQKARGDLA